MKPLVLVALATALLVSGSSFAQSARGQARDMAGHGSSEADGGRTRVEKDSGRGRAGANVETPRRENFRGGDQGRQSYAAQQPPSGPFTVPQGRSTQNFPSSRGNRPYPDQDRGRNLQLGSYSQNHGNQHSNGDQRGNFVRRDGGYRRDNGGYYSGGNRHQDSHGYYNGGNRYQGHAQYGYTNYGGRDHSYGFRYRAPRNYYRPHGYYAYNWHVGHYLPRAWYGSSYYVDYDDYGLDAPPYGYRWVRVDHDVFLVALAGGLIADILYDFYD